MGSWLNLSRVAVQRPQVSAGETVKLIAEYDVRAPTPITVKETRVVRFEGQRVVRLERVVAIAPGKGGSSVVLKVPPDAAPGFYTVTTTIEPQATTERSAGLSGGQSRASSVFRVGAAPASTSVALDQTEFRLWTVKTSHRVGETLQVFFQARREGYVTLVNVETSGKITILYPNTYSPNHAVKAGQTYSVPGAGDPYELKLGGPEGVKLVYALFTMAPTRFVEDSFITSSAFAPVNDRAEAIARDINLTVKKIPLKEQASAVLEIEVTP